MSRRLAEDAPVARMKIKRESDFIQSYDRDSSIFHDYDEHRDGEHRQEHGRMAAKKNVEFSDTTEASESRSEIGKRLAGGLNYPAVSRQSCRGADATRKRRAQKSRAAARDIITARDVGLRVTNDIERLFDSAAQEKRRDTQTKPENFAASEQRRVRDDALGVPDEGVSARNRGAAPMSRGASSSATAKISRKSRLDLSGSLRDRMEADPGGGTVGASGRALDERSAVIDRVVAMVREIALKPRKEDARTTNADDLSSAVAVAREPTARILPGCARSPENRDRSAGETDTGDVKSTTTPTATVVSDTSFQESISESVRALFISLHRTALWTI